MKRIIFLFILFCSFSAEADLSFSPWSINFGTVEVDSPRRVRHARLYNQSYDVIQNVHVSDNCFSHFYVHDNCFYLNPNRSCSVTVEYRPRREGYHTCTISASGGGYYDRLSVSGRAVRRR